jgi:AcrR family transcriptional regulator
MGDVATRDFQRARQPEQKARRRADILRAAEEMLKDGDLSDLTLNGLARRVGLGKSNIYRYFESREAILLCLFQDDIREWVEALIQKLKRMRSKSRIDRLAAVLATTTAARPRLCMFASVVSAVLERNVSVDTARAFKLANMAEVGRLIEAMTKAVPELTPEQHGELVQHFGTLVAGGWPDANPSEVVREALQDPALEGFKRDYEASLERGALLLAKGLISA